MGTSGLLSLEASIALTTFILLMLLMSSLFVVYETRNEMAHVLLTTADSLALDAFANEMPKDDTVQAILYDLYGSKTESSGTFTNHTKWYDDGQSALQQAIKERFIAYVAGGDSNEADRILKSLNIADGIEGLDFSASKVEKGMLFLEVRYKLEYEFQVFELDGFTMRQSCCSKLWK